MPEIDGFMSRATLIVELVNIALVPVLIVFSFSLYQARYKKNYQLHKKLMIFLSILLSVTILIFETDIRMNGWAHRAADSPYFGDENSLGLVKPVLAVHLVFAVSMMVLWIVVVVRALRNFPKPAQPAEHSRAHVRLARITAFDMYMTVFTGWIFFYVAFVAKG